MCFNGGVTLGTVWVLVVGCCGWAATAAKEVIVSGGAYLSPKLLLLSGVGNCADLSKLDIPCTLNLPGKLLSCPQAA